MTKFNIIPYPTSLQSNNGHFSLDEDTLLCPDSANQANAGILQLLLQPATGFHLKIDPSNPESLDSIHLTIDDTLSHLGNEGYRLIVRPDQVLLQAATHTGIFYAIQTLRQLLPAEIESTGMADGIAWQIPYVEIEDSPKFSWRGYMLDEGRHFQGIKTVKKLLDQMALFKLNIFHWHLTEDQGWRIEIKQYPKLTEIGSKRAGTVVGHPYLSKEHDHIPHEGFYTQDQIREVVAYAWDRQIMVIPEIELPGHSLAALTAYPEYSCTGGPFEVTPRWGVFPDIYCAGKPETTQFLKNILDEMVELFPAPYLHIGGDEAPKKRWKACPDCQRKIAKENLPDEKSLQTHMVNQIAAYLKSLGKRVIFWSDAFDKDIDPDAIVHFWIGNREKILESVRGGREVINSTYLSTYLDQTHITIPLIKTQKFEPAFPALPEEAQSRVLGFEGLMWGEWLPNFRRVEFQTFPRLLALAESGWRDQKTSFQDFKSRLSAIQNRLDLMDIGYAPNKKANPPFWNKLIEVRHIPKPKTGTSLPVEES